MQVTSLLSHHEHDHEHGPECGCGHDHEHSTVHIWQAVLGPDEAALAALRPSNARVYLLIERLGSDLTVRRLAAAEWAFAQALCAGTPLGAVLAAHAGLDVQGQLALHLAEGRLCGWHLSAERTPPDA